MFGQSFNNAMRLLMEHQPILTGSLNYSHTKGTESFHLDSCIVSIPNENIISGWEAWSQETKNRKTLNCNLATESAALVWGLTAFRLRIAWEHRGTVQTHDPHRFVLCNYWKSYELRSRRTVLRSRSYKCMFLCALFGRFRWRNSVRWICRSEDATGKKWEKMRWGKWLLIKLREY